MAEGHTVLDPTVTQRVLARVSAGSEEHAEIRLTEAEKRILELVVQGRNNPEIASEVSMSESTVRECIMTIHGKLEITRRSQSVTWRARRYSDQTATPTPLSPEGPTPERA
jgi:NarL family two-component system response regulator LiaR